MNTDTNPFTEIHNILSQLKETIDNIGSVVLQKNIVLEDKLFIEKLPPQLKTKHIKELFSISAPTIWAWEQKHILNPKVIRKRKYYDKAEVIKLLNQKKSKQSK